MTPQQIEDKIAELNWVIEHSRTNSQTLAAIAEREALIQQLLRESEMGEKI